MNTSQEIKIDYLFKEYTSCLSDNQRLLNKIVLDDKSYNERFYLALTDKLSKAKSLLKGMYTSSVLYDIDLNLKTATDSIISCIDGIKSSKIYLIREVKLSISDIERTFFKRDLNLIEWGSLLEERLCHKIEKQQGIKVDDKLIKESKIWENLFEFKKLDGKLLDGDVLLFNYKLLELFVEEYIGCLTGTNLHRSENHMNYCLSNINTEIDRLRHATYRYSTYEACGRIYYENIVFFKDLCNKKNVSFQELIKEEIDAQERLENDLDKFRESHEKRKTLTKAKEILDLRQEKGIKTYGTTLDEANLSDKELLNHAIEEVADLFLYLTKLKHK